MSRWSKEMRIILEDDFAVLSGSLPGAGAIVVPFWELARTGDGAFHRLLQQHNGEKYIMAIDMVQLDSYSQLQELA